MAVLTEEQTILRDQAIAWVNADAPVQAFRKMRDSGSTTGFAPHTWKAICEMGWTGIIIPEAHGGSDLGYMTFGLVLEELGKQLVASPLYASGLVAATALRLAGTDAQKESCLPAIANGEAIVTLAIDEGPKHAPDTLAMYAERTPNGWRLNGRKTFVPEGGSATHLIVAARSGKDVVLLLVDAKAAGVTREILKTADSRGYANITFNNVDVAATALLSAGHGQATLDAILDRARAGIAAEMLGTASAAFDMTLEYLKTRKQFGQVIGSFQALGHRAAELYTEMELTRSAVEAALQAIDAGSKDVPLLCSLAKFKAGAYLHRMSNQLIQIHGGIGMTDEFNAGFYLKRARAVEALYGGQGFHRDRYARLSGF
ncbi:MAG: acyl-CoA dehydrogenase [Gammaproteobacteria bacterium]|nr:acyl-CoA dehydrogenase [Gammaproteobacteria bacterium]